MVKARGLFAAVLICAMTQALTGFIFATSAGAEGTTAVTTAAYSNLRDNWDNNEPALSPTAIQSGSFGELFSTKLNGQIYSQPLVFGGMVIATTETARAYGLSSSTGAIVWKRKFGKPFKASSIGCSDLAPNVGSTSTPVIEPASGTVYLTTRLRTGKSASSSHWYLQAISASTGAEKPGFPVQISGTPSNTPGIPFNEATEMQRPGLLLLNGVVYMAFASNCDITPYRGIVVGVNASSGAITTMWSDESGVGTNESSQAGIWQSGGGLVSDIPGRIILTSGNGTSPTPAPSNKPPATLSESVIGLTVGAGGELTPSQFFAPSNAPTLDQDDTDFGAGGPIALPTEYFGTKSIPHLVVQVGKDGRVFLINADNMGGYRQGPKESDAVLQTLGPFNGVWGHPAAYGGQGGWVYIMESAGGGFLHAYSYGLTGEGQPALASAATSTESFGYTSGSPLVTSNATNAGSAVVWVEVSSGGSGEDGQLRAYNASPSGETLPLLWSQSIGTASKFAVPTAAEGRVYVGTRKGQLIAFGVKGAPGAQAPPVEAGSVPVGSSQASTLTVSANREVTLTGPVTSSGEQGNSTQSSAQTASTKSSHQRTAGPSTIPPSGNAPIADGVITVEQPRIGSAIAAGASLHLHVTFKPRQVGPVVADVRIPTNAGTLDVTITGYGTAPGIALSAPPLAFHTVETGGGGKSLSVTFTNSWTAPETLTGVSLPRGPYTVSGLPAVGTVLAPRHAVTVSVDFDPAHAGSYPSRLELVVDGHPTDIPITGKAETGVARLALSSKAIDLGAVKVGHSKSFTFTVGNSGTVPLTIDRVIAPLGAFTPVVPLPAGITIEPRTKLVIHMRFKPSTVGPAQGEYRINSSAGGGYATVVFRGRGT